MKMRIAALLLALVLAVSVLPFGAAALQTAGRADLTAATLGQPDWPNEGAVYLNKDAQPTGSLNEYEVTLTIQGKNYKTTSDVVLVIDNSNSMYETNNVSNDRMVKTKLAAKAFADKLLTEGSSTRIALVVFENEVSSYTRFFSANEKSQLIAAVNAIKQVSNTTVQGATNQQAGLHKAQELLSSADSTGKLKNIVILSDGEPTYCYKVSSVVPGEAGYKLSEESNCSTLSHKAPTVSLKATLPNATITQCDYSSPLGTGKSFELSSSYKLTANTYFNHPQIKGSFSCSHALASSKTWNYTIQANNSNGTKKSTVNITGYSTVKQTFSTKVSSIDVADCGQSTIWEANTVKAAGTTIYSVALMAGDVGEEVIRSLATDPTEGKGFFHISASDNVETKLNTDFESIAGSIAIAASNGKVTDPMSDYVDLVVEAGTDPVVTNDLTAYQSRTADVYLSQGKATWDGKTLLWDVDNINEGTPAVMKYRVKLTGSVAPGELIPTNGKTTFDYTDYQNEASRKEFKVPNVTVNGGTIQMHYYLVDAEGYPISRDGQRVGKPELAYEVKTPAYYTVNGSEALANGTYQVTRATVSGANYYGYTLDGRTESHTVTKDQDTAEVVLNNNNREVWFAYTMGFQVCHVQGGTVVDTTQYTLGGKFDLTAAVTEGYLYGGAFTNAACAANQVQTFAEGENAMRFTPKLGGVYYIWEVDQKYLKPTCYNLWKPNDEGQVDITNLYLLTPIDRLEYAKAGFTVNGKDYDAEQDGQAVAYGAVEVNRSGSLYDYIYVKDGKVRNQKGAAVTDRDAGYLGLSPMSAQLFADYKNYTEISIKPYWVTLDGIRVTAYERVIRYQGPGYKTSLRVVDDRLSVAMAPEESGTETLRLVEAYTADYDAAPVADPEPTVPEVPVEPTPRTVTVTVHDNGKTYEQPVKKGDATGALTYSAPAGKLFAGWFVDEACTIPAELRDVQGDLEVYAKYVRSAYLRVKTVSQLSVGERKVTLLSALDGTRYEETGFLVNGEKVLVSRYEKRFGIYNGRNLFGVERSAPLMIWELPLKGYAQGEKITVQPYWVTEDGTTVCGAAKTFTVTRFGLEG